MGILFGSEETVRGLHSLEFYDFRCFLKRRCYNCGTQILELFQGGELHDYCMTYSEKLRDPRWQKKRLQILERDNWCCQSCRCDDRNLQVHHLFYSKRDPWDYPDEAYQTLCDACHRERQAMVDSGIEKLRVLLGGVKTCLISDVIQSAVDHAIALGAGSGEIKKPFSGKPLSQADGKALFKAMREAVK